ASRLSWTSPPVVFPSNPPMLDKLLPYFQRELQFLRQMAPEFAEQFPGPASRLRVGKEGFVDPHVERLTQAFAFLTARIDCKLEDEFPQLTEALLGILYPHYLAPVPSMGIVQFAL